MIPDLCVLNNRVPDIIQQYRETNKDKSLKELNDLYYTIMEQLIASDKVGDIGLTLIHAKASLRFLEPLIEYNKIEYGSYDIKKIPALEKALLYFSMYNNLEQLRNIQEIISFFKELKIYEDDLEKAFTRRELITRIYEFVKENPSCSKAELKKHICFDDSQFYSSTLYYMKKIGLLIKDNRSSKITINGKI